MNRRFAACVLFGALSLGLPAIAQDNGGLPAFDPSAFAPYRSAGTGTLEGHLLVQLEGGALATRAHSPIVALPATAYTQAFMRQSAIALAHPRDDQQAQVELPLPQQLAPFARESQTDENGYFRLRKLPAGTYVVRGRLSVAFPRTVGAEDERKIVYDYSFVWLESDPVTVRARSTSNVTFHIAARRNKMSSAK